MRSVLLGITLLVIFAFVSREAQVVLEISLAIAFTLVLFISVLIDIGHVYEPEVAEKEERADRPLEAEQAGEAVEPEEAEAIVVEAESPDHTRHSS